MASACWSECVVFGHVSSFGLTFQHEKGKFQYGPMVDQVAPASVVSKTSSRSTYRWLSLFGSTTRAWLYHACWPGVPPDNARAEPALASVVALAMSFHGPAGSALADSYTPLRPRLAVDSIM